MKKLLIAAAVLLLLQAACGLPVALGVSGAASPTETPAAFSSGQPTNSAPMPQDTPSVGSEPTSTPPGKAPAQADTPDPRITLLMAQLRLYLATNPHVDKVNKLDLEGTVLNLEITTVHNGQSEQAGVAYEMAKAIAAGLSLAPKDEVKALITSGQGTLHMRVNSSDGAYHFVSDTPVAVLAQLQAGNLSQQAWMAASRYRPAS